MLDVHTYIHTYTHTKTFIVMCMYSSDQQALVTVSNTHAALSDYGSKREDGKLAVEWEVPENIEKAQASMEFMLKGCKCKGGCSTRRCS